MENFYKILGINSSATAEEIRRAYRILARRYHPDVNPGKASEDKFKSIALAYDTLSDLNRRKNYDIEFESEIKRKGSAAEQAYRRAQSAAAHAEAKRKFAEAKFQNFGKVTPDPQEEVRTSAKTEITERKRRSNLEEFEKFSKSAKHKISSVVKRIAKFVKSEPKIPKPTQGPILFSVVEVSVALHEALYGGKKTVEIAEPEGARKVSIKIPPGVRSGSVLRLRSNQNPGEDLVVILRVAYHPFISIQNKGVVVEVPITITEAINGANITVPALEESILLKVPPGSQSGQELRVRSKGVIQRDGTRGDLFYKLLIRIPEANDAIGLREKGDEMEKYYGTPPRQSLPKNLAEI